MSPSRSQVDIIAPPRLPVSTTFGSAQNLTNVLGQGPLPSYLPEQKPIGSLDISTAPKQSPAQPPIRPDNIEFEKVVPSIGGARIGEWGTASGLAASHRPENAYYKPLYFEEANLERFGRTHGFVQPALSAARFYGTIPLLPYSIAQRPPNKLYSWRWPYPSGAPAPRVREVPPVSVRGLVAEGAAVSGLVFVIP